MNDKEELRRLKQGAADLSLGCHEMLAQIEGHSKRIDKALEQPLPKWAKCVDVRTLWTRGKWYRVRGGAIETNDGHWFAQALGGSDWELSYSDTCPEDYPVCPMVCRDFPDFCEQCKHSQPVSDELPRCPSCLRRGCGGKAELHVEMSASFFEPWVECVGTCKLEGPACKSEEEAIAFWRRMAKALEGCNSW